jgi:hypothetical protein
MNRTGIARFFVLIVAVLGVGVGAVAPPASAVPVITFDGSPGTGPPPATLGPYTMTAFPLDARPLGQVVTTVPSPLGGQVTFNVGLRHNRVGSGWATWSHGYTGDVYGPTPGTTLTMTLPPNTGAFYFYAEPNPFATFDVTATAQDGTTSGPIPVSGFAGAKYFGFYGTGGATIASITVSSSRDFAVGEFGIANLLADITPPTCFVSALIQGPPKRQQVTVQDTGVGLKAIQNIQITNGTVSVPPFAPGTTSPVVVTATKTDQSKVTVWSFDAVDMNGNLRHCA